jgi:hypothetical protein
VNHSTGKATKAEQDRLDAIHNMPCLACVKEVAFAKNRDELRLGQPGKTEAHHLVDMGTREHSGGHMATIPLCSWHHRGELIYPLSSKQMRFLHGPSFARNKKDFIAQYGNERDLLEQTDAELGSAVAA